MEQTKEKEEEDSAHWAWWLRLGNSLPLSLCAMCLGFSLLFHSLAPCNAAPPHSMTAIQKLIYRFLPLYCFPFYLLSISLSAMCWRFFSLSLSHSMQFLSKKSYQGFFLFSFIYLLTMMLITTILVGYFLSLSLSFYIYIYKYMHVWMLRFNFFRVLRCQSFTKCGSHHETSLLVYSVRGVWVGCIYVYYISVGSSVFICRKMVLLVKEGHTEKMGGD